MIRGRRARSLRTLSLRRAPFLVAALLLISWILALSGRPSPGVPGAPGPAGEPAPPKPLRPAGPGLSVHVIDVGQGDSILAMLPGGRTMLIDAGEPAKARAVVSYLREHGVRHIDYLVVTHPHADHVGGMPEVLRSFSVGVVYMPKTGHTSSLYEECLREISTRGLTVVEAKKGVNPVKEGDISVSFVSPARSDYADLNDWSAVTRIRYGDVVILLMGDAGARPEREMLVASDVSPRADVLKVAHHGGPASTSAEFLEAVSPAYAVISVGAGNPYGHPSEHTIARLRAAGAEVYRTDVHGTVVIETDGTETRVITARPADGRGQDRP